MTVAACREIEAAQIVVWDPLRMLPFVAVRVALRKLSDAHDVRLVQHRVKTQMHPVVFRKRCQGKFGSCLGNAAGIHKILEKFQLVLP